MGVRNAGLDSRRRRLPRLAHGHAVLRPGPRRRGGRQLRAPPLGRGGRIALLTPIASLEERIQAWSEVSGKDIEPFVGDIAEGTFVTDVVREFEPEAIVHYGEQPSAPWSMKSVDHAVATQANNVIGSLKLLWAMRDHAPTRT